MYQIEENNEIIQEYESITPNFKLKNDSFYSKVILTWLILKFQSF